MEEAAQRGYRNSVLGDFPNSPRQGFEKWFNFEYTLALSRRLSWIISRYPFQPKLTGNYVFVTKSLMQNTQPVDPVPVV